MVERLLNEGIANFFMKKIHNEVALIIAAVIVVFDQISKHVLDFYLNLGESYPLLNNILHITLVHNVGAGFVF